MEPIGNARAIADINLRKLRLSSGIEKALANKGYSQDSQRVKMKSRFQKATIKGATSLKKLEPMDDIGSVILGGQSRQSANHSTIGHRPAMKHY